mgnify:CR=1
MYEKTKRRWHVEVEGQIDPTLSGVNRSQAALKARDLHSQGLRAKVVKK